MRVLILKNSNKMTQTEYDISIEFKHCITCINSELEGGDQPCSKCMETDEKKYYIESEIDYVDENYIAPPKCSLSVFGEE